MADQWYYARDGQRHGPATAEQLNALAVEGQLAPSDLVWKEGMAQWAPANHVLAFLSPIPGPTSAPPQVGGSPPQPASSWHYAKNGEKYGPIPDTQLRALLASRQLLPTDLVWKDGMDQWAEARNVRGLLPATAGSAGSTWIATPRIIGLAAVVAVGLIITLVVAGVVSVRKAGRNAGGDSPPTIPSGARKLVTAVGTAVHAGEWVKHYGNPSLYNVACYALPDRIIVTFDVSVEKFGKTCGVITDSQIREFYLSCGGDRYPILIRLFDRNGQYLTHFETKEAFTTDTERYETSERKWAGVRDDCRDLVHKPCLLRPQGNSLEYIVNTRDMQATERVEIGFLDSVGLISDEMGKAAHGR